MGRISYSQWTFHMSTTPSDSIQAATGCRLLAPATSRSLFQHSSTVGSGLLVTTDVVGSSTLRTCTTTLWNASVDDTALTYFLSTHEKTSLCKFNPNVVDLLIFIKI
jgi:hypothetical protein